jgi:hypothetical protein
LGVAKKGIKVKKERKIKKEEQEIKCEPPAAGRHDKEEIPARFPIGGDGDWNRRPRIRGGR